MHAQKIGVPKYKIIPKLKIRVLLIISDKGENAGLPRIPSKSLLFLKIGTASSIGILVDYLICRHHHPNVKGTRSDTTI